MSEVNWCQLRAALRQAVVKYRRQVEESPHTKLPPVCVCQCPLCGSPGWLRGNPADEPVIVCDCGTYIQPKGRRPLILVGNRCKDRQLAVLRALLVEARGCISSLLSRLAVRSTERDVTDDLLARIEAAVGKDGEGK